MNLLCDGDLLRRIFDDESLEREFDTGAGGDGCCFDGGGNSRLLSLDLCAVVGDLCCERDKNYKIKMRARRACM